MQPHQQLYRVLGIIFGFTIVWNIFIILGSIFAAAVSHTPKLFWYVLCVWIIIITICSIIKNRIESTNYKKGSLILTIMIVAGFLPTSLFLIMPSIIENYIPSWEAAHCEQIGQTDSIPPSVIMRCDNGDQVERTSTPEDMRRFWQGGVKNTHYPYSFFY
ncbi:hypothetical protein A2738_03105 [Candidatus Nomurabacteria bacterium RIFCSPHIGHO2_01_FULL_42_15]|uniref:Uncharacterized protein n=1 Tax=Candidatus Nomurabacteria bacterium RIFCSPHIGHO2_01_FULL_42_15 TaxID=1801742 RepID=A0A1F6VE41_9BACT|nr:MAG: hypothetical protein A2738_03105 [Candidatus Nomurabacteria bacterium RIFCSPHIGHO2_01_FULL_42_15]OGI92953.1 MAG: hypothetical protein A3A99_00215 [Candidatus Nomurabacteria bacterium RIFCSPLOWO2_01_FULL_41_18]